MGISQSTTVSKKGKCFPTTTMLQGLTLMATVMGPVQEAFCFWGGPIHVWRSSTNFPLVHRPGKRGPKGSKSLEKASNRCSGWNHELPPPLPPQRKHQLGPQLTCHLDGSDPQPPRDGMVAPTCKGSPAPCVPLSLSQQLHKEPMRLVLHLLVAADHVGHDVL